MARPASESTRLSADDWIQEGFRTLAEEGLKAIKVDHLCSRLGVTKGSFYWHFSDIEAYRSALATAWAEHRDEDRRSYLDLGDLEPIERLKRMMEALVSPRHWMLERAFREWARVDPRVAASVQASDRWVYRAVRQAVLDAGFEGDEAEFRARAMFAAGIGLIHLQGPAPSARGAAERERFIELMLRP